MPIQIACLSSCTRSIIITSASRIASFMRVVNVTPGAICFPVPARQQGRRSAQDDLRTEFRQQIRVRPSHAAMRDVAYNCHAQAFERCAAIENGPSVKQSLRRIISWVPSPALMIGVSGCLCKKCGAPDAAWRMIIASGRIAARVFNVSTSDSPFDTLDACAVIDTESAPRHHDDLKTGPRARRCFEKQIHHHPSRVINRTCGIPDLFRLKIARLIQNCLNLLARQAFNAQQAGAHLFRSLHQQHTFSMPSIS